MPTITGHYYEITNDHGGLVACARDDQQTLDLMKIIMETSGIRIGFCMTVTKVVCYTDDRPTMGFIRPERVDPPHLHL